jgi:hypothetical protein
MFISSRQRRKWEDSMRFDDPDNKYPRFKNYIVYDFGRLASNAAIVNGLKKWGKMSGGQARSYLIPGSGPKIVLTDDNHTRSFPYTLALSRFAVDKFESRAPTLLLTGSGKKVYSVGVSILTGLIRGHLFIFSEDNDDRDIAKVTVREIEFVREVYGDLDYNPFHLKS